MDNNNLDLSGTNIALGVSLARIFYGNIAFSLYGTVVVFLLITIWLTGGLPPLIIALALFLFPLAVFHSYLSYEFNSDKNKKWQDEDRELISFNVLSNIKSLDNITTFNLIDAALRTRKGTFIIREMGREPKDFIAHAHHVLEQAKVVGVNEFITNAKKTMIQLGRSRIDAGVILYTHFRDNEVFRDVLHECDLAIEDMESILRLESFNELFNANEPYLSPKTLLKIFGGFGRSWIMGYTDALDMLTYDLSAHIFWVADRKVKIHESKQKNAVRILEKSSLHDLLIIGDPGVGKKTLIENIVYTIRTQERSKFRAYTRVLVLKTAELLSGTASPDKFLLQALKKAQESGRFILVIEDLALMLKSGGENIKGILMKFIREKNIQLVGIINTEDYHSLIKRDPALDQFFEKLNIDEPTDEETMEVMMEHAYKFQKKITVKVTYKALRSILTLSRRYMANLAFPGKAIAVMEDAMMLAKEAKDSFVTEKHIREIVSQKGHIDITSLSEGDKDKILKLDGVLRKRIVGQERAIDALVGTLKRAALELHEENRPLGTFLFLGPTGVGKTHTAKVLADVYFGSEDRMIRLDMNEYGTESSVSGITGEGSSGSFLARSVHDQPFSLVLLDEIEKAHPRVLNLFLQILDEGFLVDSNGSKTDFRNTIIIATSNAGALFVRDYFKDKSSADHDAFKSQLLDHIIKEGSFSPEFVNRFDNVVLYHALTMDEAKQVAILMLTDIVSDLKDKKGIDIKVEEEVLNSIVEKGYSREFGAREMRRVIVETIENRLATYMLKNDVRRGEEIVIRKEE
ncbi:AAA family ATPase [Patescibacteria group bacterium]|nr:AAA family ATPase [Patescibacteria group bacterium]